MPWPPMYAVLSNGAENGVVLYGPHVLSGRFCGPGGRIVSYQSVLNIELSWGIG